MMRYSLNSLGSLLALWLLALSPAPCPDKPDLSTPERALAALAEAQIADNDDVIEQIVLNGTAYRNLIDALRDFALKLRQLEDVTIQKLGEAPEVSQQVDPQTFGSRMAEYLNPHVERDGETAFAHVPHKTKPVRLERVDGQWKVDLLHPHGLQWAQQMAAAMRTAAETVDEVTEQVDRGEITSIDQVRKAAAASFIYGLVKERVHESRDGPADPELADK